MYRCTKKQMKSHNETCIIITKLAYCTRGLDKSYRKGIYQAAFSDIVYIQFTCIMPINKRKFRWNTGSAGITILGRDRVPMIYPNVLQYDSS